MNKKRRLRGRGGASTKKTIVRCSVLQRSKCFGPGSRFQIDATVADVYLISRYNPNWIIGRPILYLVVDVYSRMVVGMYVGLEGTSWM